MDQTWEQRALEAETRLEWVALYVTEINSLNGNRVELISADDDTDSMIIVSRTGKTAVDSFLKCVVASMKQMPPRPSGRSRKSCPKNSL